MIFKSPIALLFSLAIGMSASAAPVVLSSLSERDVWVPPILTPNSGTVWKIGSCYNVTWYVEPCGFGAGAPSMFDIDPDFLISFL